MKSGNKTLRLMACAAACSIAMTAVWGGIDVEANGNTSQDSQWTIMLYLCGTDLESEGGYASINLEEICNADLSDDVSFVIETGGTQNWYWSGIDSGSLDRFHVEDNELVKVDSQPSASMGEVSTLVDFVNWSVSSYPAEKYALVFWNHGGGSVDGVCYDELYNSDNLSMPELAYAMNQMPVTLDVVGFDACLMASLECAKTLQSNGRYMVASEETEPGYGWDYTAVLNALSEDPSMDGDELGRIICDAFLAKCEMYDIADTATLSVTDLSRINAVNEAFDSYASGMAMSTQDMQSFGNVAKEAERAESFGGNTEEEGYCNLVDLIDMVRNTSPYVTGDDDGSDLVSAVQDAVVYEVHGSSRADANGLALYYPLEANENVIAYYNSFSDNVPYLQYIAALTGNYSDIDWESEYDKYEDDDYDWYSFWDFFDEDEEDSEDDSGYSFFNNSEWGED